jgi:hypothetical protein
MPTSKGMTLNCANFHANVEAFDLLSNFEVAQITHEVVCCYMAIHGNLEGKGGKEVTM